jgi:colanic acid/amylovoran biosynthesis glycosyltransferase
VPDVVAHSVNPFLFGTGSWVYTQLVGLRRWRAIVVCKRRETARTSRSRTSSLVDRPLPLQLWERLGRRFSAGTFPFMKSAIEARARASCTRISRARVGPTSLARATSIPHLTSFYGADIWKNSRDPMWRERYTALFAAGTAFLVEGNAMRAKVESLGCPREKILVQHLGVGLEDATFAERKIGSDRRVRVLASGRAVEKKGHELAVKAFARARREAPDLRLSLMIIAKSDDEKQRLDRIRSLVREEGVEDAVDFLRPVRTRSTGSRSTTTTCSSRRACTPRTGTPRAARPSP